MSIASRRAGKVNSTGSDCGGIDADGEAAEVAVSSEATFDPSRVGETSVGVASSIVGGRSSSVVESDMVV